MTEIRVVEGSDGVAHTITVFQEDSSSAEDISAFTTAVMNVRSLNLQTTIASITLTNTDLANGILTYTTDTTDGFSVAAGKSEERYKAQIKLTGAGLLETTHIFDFVVQNDIA